jgi:hypothetical protein
MVNRKYNFNPVSDIMRYFDPVWRLNLIEINLKKYTETNWFGFFTESRLHESFLVIIQMFPDTKFPLKLFRIQSFRTRHETEKIYSPRVGNMNPEPNVNWVLV